MGWPPGTGQGECTSLPGFSPMSLLYLQRLAQRLGHVGAHYTSVEGVHLSVSTPHPQQVPIFPEAGTFSLATPPMTKDRLLGLSASKFTCLKKKNHILVSCMGAVSVLRSAPQQIGWLAWEMAFPSGLRIAQVLSVTHPSLTSPWNPLTEALRCYSGTSKIL